MLRPHFDLREGKEQEAQKLYGKERPNLQGGRVAMEENKKMAIFWGVTPYSLIHTLKMEAVDSCKMMEPPRSVTRITLLPSAHSQSLSSLVARAVRSDLLRVHGRHLCWNP